MMGRKWFCMHNITQNTMKLCWFIAHQVSYRGDTLFLEHAYKPPARKALFRLV